MSTHSAIIRSSPDTQQAARSASPDGGVGLAPAVAASVAVNLRAELDTSAKKGASVDLIEGVSESDATVSDLAMKDAAATPGMKRFFRGTRKAAVKAGKFTKKHSKVIVGIIIKVCISIGGILLSADLDGNL